MGWQARVGEIASVLDTGHTARTLLGNALKLLSSAYAVVGTYEVGPLGEMEADASKNYLDGIRMRAEAEFAKIPASSEPLEDQQANQVAFQIYSIEQATGQVLEIMGGDTALGELATSVKDAIADIPALIPKPPGGYWIWVALIVGIVIFVKAR